MSRVVGWAGSVSVYLWVCVFVVQTKRRLRRLPHPFHFISLSPQLLLSLSATALTGSGIVNPVQASVLPRKQGLGLGSKREEGDADGEGAADG